MAKKNRPIPVQPEKVKINLHRHKIFCYICTMFVSEIKLYEIFKVKFGEKEAETIVEGIKQEVKVEFTSQKEILASKEDISVLKSDIARLELKIAETKVDLIKWMVGLIIASLIAQISIMIALIKLVH